MGATSGRATSSASARGELEVNLGMPDFLCDGTRRRIDDARIGPEIDERLRDDREGRRATQLELCPPRARRRDELAIGRRKLVARFVVCRSHTKHGKQAPGHSSKG